MSLEKDYKYLYLKYKNKYLSLKKTPSENNILKNLKKEFNLSNFDNIPVYVGGFFFDDDSDDEIIDNVELFGGSEHESEKDNQHSKEHGSEHSKEHGSEHSKEHGSEHSKEHGSEHGKEHGSEHHENKEVFSDTSSLAGMSDFDKSDEEVVEQQQQEQEQQQEQQQQQQQQQEGGAELDSLSDSAESLSITDSRTSENSFDF